MPDFGLLQGGTQLNPNAFGSGLSQGAGLVQLQQAAQDRQTALAEKQAAVEAAKAKAVEDAKRNVYQMQRFADVAKAPTPDALVSLQIEFPEAAAKLTEAHKALSSNEQKANLGLAQRVYAAANANDVNLSIDLLKNAAEAKRNAGDEKGAKALDDNARLLLENPDEAKATIGLFVAEAMGPTEFLKTFQGLQTSSADVQKAQAEADIKQVQAKREDEKIMASIALDKANTARLYNLSKFDAERLGIDKDRLRIEAAKELREVQGLGGLSKDAQKMVTEAAVDAASASVEQKSITDIAALFGEKQAPMLDGSASAAGRFVGGQLGFSTEEQLARQKYGALVEKMVSADLKGLGNATEADRAAASRAYPDKDAPFKVIKAFLDDKAIKIDDRRQRKKAEIEYIGQNGSIGPARGRLLVGGVEVMPGETFDEAIIRIENSK